MLAVLIALAGGACFGFLVGGMFGGAKVSDLENEIIDLRFQNERLRKGWAK